MLQDVCCSSSVSLSSASRENKSWVLQNHVGHESMRVLIEEEEEEKEEQEKERRGRGGQPGGRLNRADGSEKEKERAIKS